MTVYLVARITITDRERYAQYGAGFMDILSGYRARLLAVDEAPQVLEGMWECTRTVILEFESQEEANAWYRSEAYQALAQHRYASSKGDIVMLQGMAGGD